MPGNSKGGRGQGSSGNKGGNNGGKQNTSNRGFASMDEEKQKEIASKGGKASHKNDDKQRGRGSGGSR
jgi:hypothetical protein